MRGEKRGGKKMYTNSEEYDIVKRRVTGPRDPKRGQAGIAEPVGGAAMAEAPQETPPGTMRSG
jgi:hypothetical protein